MNKKKSRSRKTKPGAEVSSPATYSSLKSLAKAVKPLWAKEQAFEKTAKQAQLDALCIALRIGAMIYEFKKGAKRGEGRMETIAAACGLGTQQSAYNYLYVYRGAVNEKTIRDNPLLTRKYWQAIGRSIVSSEDLPGMMLHYNIVKNPQWTENKRGEQVPDSEKITEVGRLLQDYRNLVKNDLKAEYMLEVCDGGAIADLSKTEPIDGWIPCLVSEATKGFALLVAYREEDEDVFAKVILGLKNLMLDVNDLTGSSTDATPFTVATGNQPPTTGRQNKPLKLKTVLHNRTRQRKIDACLIPADHTAATDGLEEPPSANEENVAPKQTKKAQVGTKTDEAAFDEPKQPKQKLYLGRCEKILQDQNRFTVRSVDAVIADPPYSAECNAGWRAHTEVDHEMEATVEAQAEHLALVAQILIKQQIIKERFIWFSFCPMDMVHVFLPPLIEVFSLCEPNPHFQVLTWDKQTFTPVGGTRTFSRQAEAILYFNIGDKPLGELTSDEGKARIAHTNLFSVGATKNRLESWKPPKLLELLVKLSTYDESASSQVILDPFAGKGSTGVAAIKAGRDYRLIECHEKQFELAEVNIRDALSGGGAL